MARPLVGVEHAIAVLVEPGEAFGEESVELGLVDEPVPVGVHAREGFGRIALGLALGLERRPLGEADLAVAVGVGSHERLFPARLELLQRGAGLGGGGCRSAWRRLGWRGSRRRCLGGRGGGLQAKGNEEDSTADHALISGWARPSAAMLQPLNAVTKEIRRSFLTRQ